MDQCMAVKSLKYGLDIFLFSEMNEVALINLQNIMLTKTSNLKRDIYNQKTFINNFIKQKYTVTMFMGT